LRLASAAAAPSTPELDRLTFLKSAFAAEPEVARRFALDLAEDGSYPVRLTCAEIILASRGSEDDLPRLLSVAARESDPTIRELLRDSIDALNTRDPSDSLGRLLALLDVPPALSDLHELISDPSLRQRFLRWADKVVSRAAEASGHAALISACAELASIVLDAAVVNAADHDREPRLDPETVAAVRDSLAGRPAPAQLAADPAVAAAFPWSSTVALLAELAADRSHEPPFATTDADRSGALRTLAEVTSGWLTSAQEAAPR
jgi:hypothetical protein